MKSQPLVDFVDIVERAAIRGVRAHLPVEVVRAVISHPGYAAYQQARIQELASSWEPLVQKSVERPYVPPPGDPSTFTPEQQELLHRVGTKMALEACQAVRRKPAAPNPAGPKPTRFGKR